MENKYLPRTNLSIVSGFALFIFLFLLMLVMTSLLAEFVTSKMTNQVAGFRILTVVQDLLVFILPAVVTALLMTRLPARFLNIDLPPYPIPLTLALVTLLVSIPFMNRVIEWNANIQLPEALEGLEAQMRQMEDTAETFINSMMNGSSVGSLILSIAIIGVLAGLSEELFFRGALQKLLLMTGMNHHVAIWTGAVIFSVFHFQFFGFVPRLLLGAYFGYLVWWTRSLWIPIIIHSINNSIVVVTEWHEANLPENVNVPDEGGNLLVNFISLLFMVAGLYLIRRACNPKSNSSVVSQ
ncbi:MAG: CPBP family intramembrane metalloprotease [Muribaculaceae bacterium]|nr:CPBP family intramembrane metalloprotease [Muribaculaceae bacterium]